jgi:pimeloyl-ACP methyl ester carboxylesterase
MTQISTAPPSANAPAWFHTAVSHARSRHLLAMRDGLVLHLAGWNAQDVHKPVLLLVHGYRGNTHWWDFIAPWLTGTHTVYAVDLAGMGDSGHRTDYSPAAFAADLVEVIDFLVKDAPGGRISVAAHSFAGSRLLEACAQRPEHVSHALLLDSRLSLHGDPQHTRTSVGNPRPYPDRSVALARFRLLPDQPALPYACSYLAEHALRPVASGWTWQFDPALPPGIRGEPLESYAARVQVPVDLVRGQLSIVLGAERMQRIAALLPHCRSMVEVPDAQHHLMLDQPLALVATLRSLLACAPR